MNTRVVEWLGLKRPAGVHPPGHKALASGKAIERVPLPESVVLPLQQHIGSPAQALVKRGDEVKVGQKIAQAGPGFCSAPVHATVSGEVKQLLTVVSPITGDPVAGVAIESNGEDEWLECVPADAEALSAEEILARIKEAGIVGLGGAAFPTYVKLSRPPESPAHTLLVNGAECEPYITADAQLMLEQTDRILQGIKILARLLSVSRVYIAVEDNKPQAIEQMRRAVSESDLPGEVTVSAVEAKYPMGAEKTLVKEILGVEVPEGGFPTDIGVVVQNVATLAAVTDAVVEGRPLVERVVTVTGLVNQPKNVLARFGTSASHLIEQCGGADPRADEVIFGGPMMGIAQPSAASPIVKSTNCVLVKSSDIRVEYSCIRCGRCVATCPMSLMPLMFVNYVKAGDYEGLNDYSISSCVECGACTYDCPANIPIVAYVKVGKAELRKREAT